MKLSFVFILSAALLAVGCSPGSDGKPVIAGSQRQALDKAKGVEATVQQSADETKQKVDEQAQ
jgi:hypothetical protein